MTERAALCRNCWRPITTAITHPPIWWHLHNSSVHCDTTRAEPDD